MELLVESSLRASGCLGHRRQPSCLWQGLCGGVSQQQHRHETHATRALEESKPRASPLEKELKEEEKEEEVKEEAPRQVRRRRITSPRTAAWVHPVQAKRIELDDSELSPSGETSSVSPPSSNADEDEERHKEEGPSSSSEEEDDDDDFEKKKKKTTTKETSSTTSSTTFCELRRPFQEVSPQQQQQQQKRGIMKHKGGMMLSASSNSLVSLESDDTDFAERSSDEERHETKVQFDLSKNREYPITAVGDMSFRMRRDCYWQAEEYQQMSQSRQWLERTVLRTGGRVRIQGESRRGLGLVCEPETRLARASKIQSTQRAILRMASEGASSAKLARFAAESSFWATRNALICAQKDLVAAHEDTRAPPPQQRTPPPQHTRNRASSSDDAFYYGTVEVPLLDATSMHRIDSNTSDTDGLASLIRNDSLNNLRDNDTLAAYAAAHAHRHNFGGGVAVSV